MRSRALPSRSPSPSESLNFFFSPDILSLRGPKRSFNLPSRDRFLGFSPSSVLLSSFFSSFFFSGCSEDCSSSFFPGKNLPLIKPSAPPNRAPVFALFSLNCSAAFSAPAFRRALPSSVRSSKVAFFSFTFSATSSFFLFNVSVKASFFKAALSFSCWYLSLKISPKERVFSSPIWTLASSSLVLSLSLVAKAFFFRRLKRPSSFSSPSLPLKKSFSLPKSFLLSSLTLSMDGSFTTGPSSLTIPRLILIFCPSILRSRILRTWIIVFKVRLPINCMAGTGSFSSLTPFSLSPALPINPVAKSLTRPAPSLSLSSALKA